MLTIFADSFVTASRVTVKTGPVLPDSVASKRPGLLKRLLHHLKARRTLKKTEHV